MNETALPKKKIQLLHDIWTVFVVPADYPRLLNAQGLTQFNYKKIYIANNLSKKDFRQVLMHEYSQAFFSDLGIHSPLLEKMHQEKNEKTVDDLVETLYPRSQPSILKQHQMKGRERE